MRIPGLSWAVLAVAAVCADSLRGAIASRLQNIDDTNLANYGSQAHIDARTGAAESEAQFQGAGAKPGLEVWRVENTRTASDTPLFGVKRWTQSAGTFYSGDSYVVLNSYLVESKLVYDLHFWLGSTSSVDEIGVAAYKTVELDDFLHGQAVQHRELQGFESPLFLSYFPQGLVYLDGGMDSGFRVVRPEEYEPRLFQVRKFGSNVNVFEVLASVRSLNQGDAFVLDSGLVVYVFEGSSASAFEKSKASLVAFNLVQGRFGKSRSTYELDAAFWQALGGTGVEDVGPAVPDGASADAAQAFVPQLYKLSDLTGTMVFSKVAQGAPLPAALLDPSEVFVLDAGVQILVWVGANASWSEKSQAMAFVTKYMKSTGRPLTLPVTTIQQGQPNLLFADLVK